jgi:hypothetical protein
MAPLEILDSATQDIQNKNGDHIPMKFRALIMHHASRINTPVGYFEDFETAITAAHKAATDHSVFVYEQVAKNREELMYYDCGGGVDCG